MNCCPTTTRSPDWLNDEGAVYCSRTLGTACFACMTMRSFSSRPCMSRTKASSPTLPTPTTLWPTSMTW